MFTTTYQKDIDALRAIGTELRDYERSVINLIASDNAFPAAVASNPVYAWSMIQEGLVGKRPFAGARLHDELENKAIEIACKVFGAEHANLQPHSCSQANQAVFHAFLSSGDTALALGFQAGGHLTHGLRSNFSGRHYRFVHYGVGQDELIDYDALRSLADTERPKLIVCGSSSYPRLFDVDQLRSIADSVGAKLMLDLSHEAGLIAGGAIPNVVPRADAVTMSIDKTLRGPFGGIILCKREYADLIERAVHPGTQSSFPLFAIASKAHSLALTQSPEFKEYTHRVIRNTQVLASAFPADALFTAGTDKHYLVVNVKKLYGLTGTEAETLLEEVGILSSRQSIPSDQSKKMSDAGGIRLGTPWISSRGYDTADCTKIASLITQVLSAPSNQLVRAHVANEVRALVTPERAKDVWSEEATLDTAPYMTLKKALP
jgi:glycine hydroxymethyltransferase